MTTIAPSHLVASNIPEPVPALSSYTHALIAAMTGNGLIPNPNPSIATLTDLVTKLDNAQTATKTGTKGTVAVRDAAEAALRVALRASRANVQALADASPEQAEALAKSLGMALRKPQTRTKALFAAKPGTVSGSVVLTAKAVGGRASYDWEWSSDGGHTWTQVLPTLKAKTTITGLPVATTCQFRFRSLTKAGVTDWSQIIVLVVK